jgi:hypothetical protein
MGLRFGLGANEFVTEKSPEGNLLETLPAKQSSFGGGKEHCERRAHVGSA